MAEQDPNAIFNRVIVGDPIDSNGEEHTGISLRSSDEVNISMSKPLQVVMREAFSIPSPMLIATFLDAHGDAMNATKLDSAATYTLTLESYDGSKIESKWNLSHIDHANSVIGSSEQGTFSVHFVHETWKKFAYEIHCRGWSNKKYSDVVKEIADECNFDVTDIIETEETLESIQQPNWTDAKMMRWIMSRAGAASKGGEYEYSISMDGKFVFAPFSSYINREFKIREGLDNIPIIYLGGQPNQSEERRKNNSGSNIYASNYSIVEDSTDNHKQGAGGVVNAWYDYNEAEYKREPLKYSETSNVQTSEWSLVNEDYEDSPLFLSHGRNHIEAETIGENRICSIVNSMQKVRVLLPSSTVLRVGEVVNFKIPNPLKFVEDQGKYNEVHSGKYVIASVTNNLDNDKKDPTFTTEILLVRQGIDKKESSYYTKSSGGKA